LKLELIYVILPCPIFPSASDSERELEKSGCGVEDFRKNPKSYDAGIFSRAAAMAANRMQRIFQLRSSEKSFVSRISPRNPCLPAIIAAAKWLK